MSVRSSRSTGPRLPGVRPALPVDVLTGFLGSGKTTLLSRLLREPAFARTAVIVNEFGEVGIDHDLVETSDEQFIQLTTGCLCCKVRSDLVETLLELASRRAQGRVPAFERVVIETSGLADPAPILQALMLDGALSHAYVGGSVITTVDALLAARTLEQQPTARRQVAMADALVVTKTDLDPAAGAALQDRLRALNPDAPVLPTRAGASDAAAIWSSAAQAVQPWRAVRTGGGGRPDDHLGGVDRWILVRERPLPAAVLPLLVEALSEHCGERLLRVKGIVAIDGEPQRPVVVQGVQHVFHPLQWLDAWPSADRRSRLVFIGEDVPGEWIESLLDCLVAEVGAVQASIETSQA